MASKNIKGITIEIDGDVTKLDKALSSVDKDLSATQKNLKEVERLLKLDPKNVELLDQKQRLLAQAVEQTSKRYDTLKKTLDESTGSNVQAEKWAEAQRQFQSEITKTENALTKLLDEQKRMEGLKFAPDSAEMVDLQKRIDATREKSEDLRRQAAETFEELGRPISVDQYDALQRELAQSKYDMEQATAAAQAFEAGADDMGDAAADAGEDTSKLDAILGELGLSKSALTAAGAITFAVEAIKAFVEWTADAVTSAAEYADEILTLSTNYGIATDTLQEYRYMAELTDTSLDTITGSISKLTKSMNSARDGTGDAADAFAKLNIRVTENGGQLRDSEEVFNEVIAALGFMTNETERDALAQTLLGKSAMELNSLIATGRDGIAAYAQEAREMGYVLSRDELEALGAVDDQFQRLDKAMEMAKNRIAIELAPELIELTGRLLDVIEAADWTQVGHSIAVVLETIGPLVIGLTEAVAGLAMGLGYLFEAAEKAANAIGNLFGKSTTSTRGFGSSFTASGIRGFASGGVIEPNNPMLAVVGDNRSEREVIAPESLVRGAVADALAANGGAGGAIVINATFSGTDDQIIRAIAPKLEAYQARRGAVL